MQQCSVMCTPGVRWYWSIWTACHHHFTGTGRNIRG